MNSNKIGIVWMRLKQGHFPYKLGDKDLKVSRSYNDSTRTGYGFSNLISAINQTKAHAGRIFFLAFLYVCISSYSLNPFHRMPIVFYKHDKFISLKCKQYPKNDG